MTLAKSRLGGGVVDTCLETSLARNVEMKALVSIDFLARYILMCL